jgi:hypothetical protein
MRKQLGEKPAFAAATSGDWQAGMTLREHAAIEAMKGILANPIYVGNLNNSLRAELGNDWVQVMAITHADALITALAKE